MSQASDNFPTSGIQWVRHALAHMIDKWTSATERKMAGEWVRLEELLNFCELAPEFAGDCHLADGIMKNVTNVQAGFSAKLLKMYDDDWLDFFRVSVAITLAFSDWRQLFHMKPENILPSLRSGAIQGPFVVLYCLHQWKTLLVQSSAPTATFDLALQEALTRISAVVIMAKHCVDNITNSSDGCGTSEDIHVPHGQGHDRIGSAQLSGRVSSVRSVSPMREVQETSLAGTVAEKEVAKSKGKEVARRAVSSSPLIGRNTLDDFEDQESQVAQETGVIDVLRNADAFEAHLLAQFDNGEFPSWVTKNVLKVMCTFVRDGGDLEKLLVDSWANFEQYPDADSSLIRKRGLPTHLRPDCVTTWMGKRRNDEGPELHARHFGQGMHSYVLTLVPASMHHEGGEQLPPDGELDENESWDNLMKWGQNGVGLLVLMFCWWKPSIARYKRDHSEGKIEALESLYTQTLRIAARSVAAMLKSLTEKETAIKRGHDDKLSATTRNKQSPKKSSRTGSSAIRSKNKSSSDSSKVTKQKASPPSSSSSSSSFAISSPLATSSTSPNRSIKRKASSSADRDGQSKRPATNGVQP